MMVVPYRTGDSEYAVYVILGRDSLDRIADYDPAVIQLNKLSGPWQRLRLVEIVITWATEAEFKQIIELATANKPREALKLVTRGFRFRPDLGDYDGPPLSVKPDPGQTKQ